MFEVIGTDDKVAPQGRKQYQRSVFISRFCDELELGITADTLPNSYYPVETSAAGQLVRVEIPKPVGERLSRNEEAEM